MSVRECAALMGKSQMFVRCGLREGKFPFGYAVKMSSRWTYHISAAKVHEYLGITPRPQKVAAGQE
jgi:hypothetical protein